MTLFHILSQQPAPRLWVWRDRQAGAPHELAYDAQARGNDDQGFRIFHALLDHQLHQPAHMQLYSDNWAWQDCRRDLPRGKDYRFPQQVWMAEGAARVLTNNPFADRGHKQVRIHLITAEKYKEGQLYIWLPGKEGRSVPPTGRDRHGPIYSLEQARGTTDVPL